MEYLSVRSGCGVWSGGLGVDLVFVRLLEYQVRLCCAIAWWCCSWLIVWSVGGSELSAVEWGVGTVTDGE